MMLAVKKSSRPLRTKPFSTKKMLFLEKLKQYCRMLKLLLPAGHRVTFGTLLDVDKGFNGALGTYKVKNDTWILTSAIARDAKRGDIEAGHEMIIIGYDDKAKVKDSQGETHKGLLTLRNSWGEELVIKVIII